MKKSPARIEAEARRALQALTALQSSPLMLHTCGGHTRINSISYMHTEFLRLTCKEIIRKAQILQAARARGVRNLTPPRTLPQPQPCLIPTSSLVVFGD